MPAILSKALPGCCDAGSTSNTVHTKRAARSCGGIDGVLPTGTMHTADQTVKSAKGGVLLCPLDLAAEERNSTIMNSLTPFPGQSSAPQVVAFHRTELSVILSLYGRMVAAGEWRDYGISTLRDVAVFSVFKRTAENPLYRIEKRPKLRTKQGEYAVIGADGQMLKRGHDLKTVLRVLERKLIRAVDLD